MTAAMTVESKHDLLQDLRSSDLERSQYALRVLLKNVSTKDVIEFLRGLRANEWEAKISACRLLEKTGDEKAIEKLKALILDFNPRVRQEAARSLRKLGIDKPFSDDEVAELVSYLDHSSWWVKTKAIKSLEAIRDPRALEPISKLILDEDEAVREAALEAVDILGKLAQ